MNNPLQILKEGFNSILLTGLVAAVLFLLVSLLFPLRYQADSQVIVITKGEKGLDAYTAMRSAKKIGENLANIVETNDFFAKVTSNLDDSKLSKQFSGLSERERRKLWRESVDASLNYGTGMLTVSTYHVEPKQAKKMNKEVLEVLLNQTSNYIGQKVNLKVVNPPLVSEYPTKPNLIINTIAGFFVGIVVSFGYLWYKKKQEHHFWFG
ncbi:MAG: hypothetical protein ABEJ02_00270 [Candidatus Paceibacteria bacterium]